MSEPRTLAPALDRAAAVAWYRKNRRRSRELFDLVAAAVYDHGRPIPLRHPIVFYEGHLPAFSFNTLCKRALGEPGIRAEYETLFARGIDPEDEAKAAASGVAQWPSRDEVLAFAEEADRRVLKAIATAEWDRAGVPLLDRGEAVSTILEHEAMHHETLLYIYHRLPYETKEKPAGARAPLAGGDPPLPAVAYVPAGAAMLGADRAAVPFGWDNEFGETRVSVPAFAIDVFNVTSRDFIDFVDAGGYDRRDLWSERGWAWRQEHKVSHPLSWERDGGRWWWRGMFERVPLPPAWPVYVSWEEASAYACWQGARLPSEAEYHRAAFGDPSGEERPHPWGEAPPNGTRGNFDFGYYDPVPVGSYPAGRSAWGIHDLVGNGWEWTSTVFDGLPGFTPMASYPEYSADFFDGQHYVMKGASPATARELVRRSFRNWFRPNYPYVYATFRCVREG
jgi:ergothioneine biosynthesis protein EgtB